MVYPTGDLSPGEGTSQQLAVGIAPVQPEAIGDLTVEGPSQPQAVGLAPVQPEATDDLTAGEWPSLQQAGGPAPLQAEVMGHTTGDLSVGDGTSQQLAVGIAPVQPKVMGHPTDYLNAGEGPCNQAAGALAPTQPEVMGYLTGDFAAEEGPSQQPDGGLAPVQPEVMGQPIDQLTAGEGSSWEPPILAKGVRQKRPIRSAGKRMIQIHEEIISKIKKVKMSKKKNKAQCQVCKEPYVRKSDNRCYGRWVGCENHETCNSWAHAVRCLNWKDSYIETDKEYACPSCRDDQQT